MNRTVWIPLVLTLIVGIAGLWMLATTSHARVPLSPDGDGLWLTYTTQNSGLAFDVVTSIAVDADGTVWFGTADGRASAFNGSRWKTYRVVPGMTGNQITTVVPESLGRIWFGTTDGAHVLDDGSWITYRPHPGLPSEFQPAPAIPLVHTVAVEPDGDTWFGTGGAGVSFFDGQTWTHYVSTNSGLAQDDVRAAFVDAQGRVWFGTFGGGVSVFDGEVWVTYNTRNSGLGSDFVTSIAGDRSGNIWFGHLPQSVEAPGGVSQFNGTSWTHYTMANSGLGSNQVLAVALDAGGHPWIGTVAGVSTFDAQGWRTYREGDGLAGNVVSAVAIDGAGGKWFGTSGGGVSWFRENVAVFRQYLPILPK